MPIVALPNGMAANSIQSNPWNPSQYIVSAATNFGITGGGGIFLLSTPPLQQQLPSSPLGSPPLVSGPASVIGNVTVPGTGVLDAAVSEVNGSLAIAGCADGSLLVCMFSPTGGGAGSIVGRVQGTHRSDVASLAWNPSRSSLFATGSWDRGVRVFDVERVGAAAAGNAPPSQGGASNLASIQFGGPASMLGGHPIQGGPPNQPPLPPPSTEEIQRGGHSAEVYEVSWCPKQPHLLASVGGDGGLKIWDMRTAASPASTNGNGNGIMVQQGGGGGSNNNRPVLSVDAAHGGGGGGGPPRRSKVMTVSWNYYEPFICATGGTDNTAKIWDLRKIAPPRPAAGAGMMMGMNTNDPSSQPLVHLHSGHQAPVRRVRFSPHHRTCLLTGGYDYRVCMWNINNNSNGGGSGGMRSSSSNNTLLQYRHDHHREFVTDVEWCMDPRAPLSVASSSWDGTVAFWKLGGQLTP